MNNNDCIFDSNIIVNLIPHREPFLFIDRLIEIKKGVYAKCEKYIDNNEWFLKGHFPGNPIVPGVIIIEAIGQTFALLSSVTMLLEKKYSLDNIKDGNVKNEIKSFLVMSNIKFIKPVFPGNTLQLTAKCGATVNGYCRASVQAVVNREVVSKGTMSAKIF